MLKCGAIYVDRDKRQSETSCVSPWTSPRDNSLDPWTRRRRDTRLTANRISLTTLSASLLRWSRCGRGTYQVQYTYFLYSKQCVTAAAIIPAVLVPKIHQQQSFLSKYRSEVIIHLLVPCRICSCYRIFRTQHSKSMVHCKHERTGSSVFCN